MRERFGADDRSCQLRFHTQTGGSTLTAQQPLNNVVRVTLQALAAVLGGTQSLHTNAYDEALALPSEASGLLAVRTQQVLAHESGVTATADPLGGSHYLEALTGELEARARDCLERIDELGGAARAVEFMKEEIQRAAYHYQLEVEAGHRTVVGVNAFQEAGAGPALQRPDYAALEEAQRDRVAAVRRLREPRAVEATLSAVRAAARGERNLIPPMIDAVKALATLGEISDVLRQEWGTFDEA
jgi:methylmalonyl-CoA mutase N-terminal domain/subunit